MPTLIVSPLAEEDLEEIWSFVAERDVGAARVLAQSLLAVSLEASPPLPESRPGDAAAAADEAGVLSAGVESNPGEARLNLLLNVAHASA